MVEAGARDTLQPALLDRLTDDDPRHKVEGRESRVISRSQLRAFVLRDLSWLFNTTNISAEQDFTGHPLAEQSTINYGLVPLSGKVISSLDVGQLEQVIKQTIMRFEPRILPHTLTVRGLTSVEPLEHHNVFSFEIAGSLWAQPYPLELLLKTDLDLESGEVHIAEGR
jgi:type VI secretion system protein ImpF